MKRIDAVIKSIKKWAALISNKDISYGLCGFCEYQQEQHDLDTASREMCEDCPMFITKICSYNPDVSTLYWKWSKAYALDDNARRKLAIAILGAIVNIGLPWAGDK